MILMSLISSIAGAIVVTVLISVYRNFLKREFFVWFKRRIPPIFQQEYELVKDFVNIEVGKIIKRSYPSGDARHYEEDPCERIDKIIKRYNRKADRLWSSIKCSDRYRSAYFYALAAYTNVKLEEELSKKEGLRDYCSPTKRFGEAGRFYHFAGHTFRALEEYELAGKCYKWSGDLFKKAAAYQNFGFLINARRAYRRAKKVFFYVGDDDIADKIDNLEREVMTKIKDNPEIANEHFEWLGFSPGAFRKEPEI